MFSLIKNNKKILSFLFLSLIITTVSILSFHKSFEERFLEAEQLADNWQLQKSNLILETLLKDNPNDVELNELYGSVLLKMGELYKSREVYLKLISQTNSNNIKNKFNLAFTYFYLNQLDSAGIALNEITTNTNPINNPILFSQILNLKGLMEFNIGKYGLARNYQQKSLDLAKKHNAINEQANALRQLGVLDWYSGKLDSVIDKYYKPALVLYRLSGDKKGEATTLSNIGLIYWNYDNWFEDLKYQLKAFQIRKEINDRIGLADSYYFLTYDLPENKNGYKFAYSYSQKSYKLSSKIGYAWGKEIASRSLVGLRTKSIVNLTEIKEDSVFNYSVENRINNIWIKAISSYEKKEFKTSAILFRKSFELSELNKIYVGIENSMIIYSDVLMQLGRFKEAQKNIEEAMKITLSLNRPNGYAESLYVLAKLKSMENKKEEALKIFPKLIGFYDSLYVSDLKSVNPSLAYESALRSTHKMRSKIYNDYIKTLIQLKKYPAAFDVMEKERSLPLWDSENDSGKNGKSYTFSQIVKIIENIDNKSNLYDKKTEALLDSIYNKLLLKKEINTKAYSNYSNKIKYKLNDVMKVLLNNEVLLEYFVNDNNVYVFVVRHDKFKVIKLEIESNELAAAIDVFDEAILSGKNSPSNNLWESPSKYLYNVLIEPLREKSLLNDTDNLIIAAHQFINFIPFSSLLDSNNKFLTEEYILSYIPSANYLVDKKNKKHDRIKNILAFAPDMNSLPYTEKEIDAIDETEFNSVKLLKEENATAEKLFSLADKYDLIHIASHGKINPENPLRSYLKFSERNVKLNEILFLKLKAKLILITACETGLSESKFEVYPSGPDIISFPRAFITAGASSVISPLWLVEDKSTSELITLFYKYLLIYRDKNIPNIYALALNSAQREFVSVSRKTKIKNHPFYWAGFYLMGYNN